MITERNITDVKRRTVRLLRTLSSGIEQERDVPESSFMRTGRVPSDRRAAMMSDPSGGTPLVVRAGVTSAS